MRELSLLYGAPRIPTDGSYPQVSRQFNASKPIVLLDFLESLFADPFAVMNAIGLVAFAFVGATKAIREEFDLFGVTIVGLVTAFVGGATRDVLVGRVPLALQHLGEIGLGMLGVALAITATVVRQGADDHPVTLVADAIGLAAFATAGAIVGMDFGVSSFGVVALGTINAVGGGSFADILLDRSPWILFEDFYASSAVLGGITYLLVSKSGTMAGSAAAACAIVTAGSRLVAVRYGWHLPTARALGVRPPKDR